MSRVLLEVGKLLFVTNLRKNVPRNQPAKRIPYKCLNSMITISAHVSNYVELYGNYYCSDRLRVLVPETRNINRLPMTHYTSKTSMGSTTDPSTIHTILCRKIPNAVRRRERYVGEVDILMPTRSVWSTTRSPTVSLRPKRAR